MIISFTSPRDACTAAAVSPVFKSAAEYDAVWERFLPPDYEEIVSGSDLPVSFSTKKELYFLLCDSALIVGGGKMSFRLNRSTGKKCCMLSARELEIVWIDTPIHWQWTSLPESRFGEVAELLSVCWLEIRGTMRSQILSPNTNYAAFLVFKLSEEYYGLDGSSKASVKVVKDSTTKKTEGDDNITTVYIVPPRRVKFRGRVPSSREDGWLEIELGEFFVDEGDECDVLIQLDETEHLNWKKGLIVEGIEVRPKQTF
ncbi:F-box protein at2g02240 [Phtheirospermum japonicum]|uniref:F-box protein at2g02240 n=1 Tax=Phtheirospermum japonicum TaxID=374723 RepID=A0A830CNI6_9LAMI|nr:F-box protein at2g02240 [Phtheirospermum japonicum]